LSLAKTLGKATFLDCGGRSDPLSPEIVALLDFISPNQTELDALLEST